MKAKCGHCGGETLEYEDNLFVDNDDVATHTVLCVKCGKVSIFKYNLVSIEGVE